VNNATNAENETCAYASVRAECKCRKKCKDVRNLIGKDSAIKGTYVYVRVGIWYVDVQVCESNVEMKYKVCAMKTWNMEYVGMCVG